MKQLTGVERTRAVSMAQQETVSLAQMLKVGNCFQVYNECPQCSFKLGIGCTCITQNFRALDLKIHF